MQEHITKKSSNSKAYEHLTISERERVEKKSYLEEQAVVYVDGRGFFMVCDVMMWCVSSSVLQKGQEGHHKQAAATHEDSRE